MNIAFTVLFVSIFFFAISFNLAMSHEQALLAAEQNISALAIAAQAMDGHTVKILSLLLNIFSIMTAFFGVFLAFKESCQGIALNLLKRVLNEEKINTKYISIGTLIFGVLVSWSANVLNLPILRLLAFLGPSIGIVGCLIPAILVYKVPFLHKYKGISLYLIICTGLLLILAPFLGID